MVCFNVSVCLVSIRFNEAEVAYVTMQQGISLRPLSLRSLN